MEATYPKKQLNHQQYHHHHPMCCHMNSSTPSPHITTTFTGKPKTGSMTPITQYFLSDHHLQGAVDNGHYSKDSPSQHPQPLDDNFSWHTQHMSPAVPNYRAAMTSPRQPQMSPSYNAATNFINPRNVNSYGISYNTAGDLDAQTQYRNDLPDPYRQPKGQLNSPNPSWNSYSIAYTEDLNKNPPFQPKYVASTNHGMPHYNMPQSLVMPNFNSDPNNSTPTLNQLLQAPTFIMQHQTSNMLGHPNRNDLKQSGHSPRFTSNQFNSLNQPINNNSDKKDFPQFSMESAGHVPQSFPYRPLSSRNPSNHLNDTNSQFSHSSNYGSVHSMDQKFMPDDNSNRPGLFYGNENNPQSYAQNLDSHRRSPAHQANPTKHGHNNNSTPNDWGDNSNNNDKISANSPPPPNLLNQMLLSSSSTNNNPSPKTPSQGSSSTLTLEGEETSHGPVGQHQPQAATHKRLHKLKRESSAMAAPSSPNSNGAGVVKTPRDYKRRKKGGPEPGAGVPPPPSSSSELVTINNYNSAESNSNMSSLTGGASNNSYHQGLNSPAPAFVAVPTPVNASNPPGSLPNTFPNASTSIESGNFVVRNETDSNSLQDASLLSSNGFKYQSQKSSATPINLSSYSPDQSSSASFKEENSGNLNSPGWLSKSITSPPINPSQSPSLSRIDKINHNLRVKKNEPIAKLYDFGSEPERKPFLDHLLQFNEQNANPIPFIPTVSKAYVDLYKLYCMVKERGGILMVNQRKQWREIAAEILDGHSASTSYNLRKQYIKCLLDYECKFEMNGADPAPIITQIELSVKKKKKKVDPSQVSCSQSIVSSPCSLPFQPTKNNITGLPNPSTPFPSSPALNYMQSHNNHNNNGSNPAGPLNISPPSERIKVRDPFSDDNPSSNTTGPGGMYGNFKGMPYNNNMPPSHLSNVGVHPFAKLHPGPENVRTNTDPSPHPSMQPVVYNNNNNQFHTKPFTPELQNPKMMMAEHQQQPYNEFARANRLFNQSPMQHDIKPPPPGNMLNSPTNLPLNMDKRVLEQGLLKSQMPIEHFPTDPSMAGNLLIKSEIKCEFMSDQRSMEPPSLQSSEMFYKDPEMGHPLIPQQGGEMPANNFSLQSSNQDFDTNKHSKPKIPDPTQLDYNYRGSRFSSSNLFHDIPPNVAITENSIDPRSLKHTSRSTLSNTISKDPLFPPDSVEAIVPKYVKHKKIHGKDLGNIDLRKIQLALKSGLVSLGVHTIDAFSVLQSEESKLSQFHLSQCQGLLDLLIEYFQASLEVLFHLSRGRKTLLNPLETSHPDIVEGGGKEDILSLNLNAKEAKERMRSGKNYTMTTRTKKSVRFKRATPNEIDPLASQSRFEQQVFDHDDTLFRCPLPCFDRCLVNFRPDLAVVSEKDEIRQQHEPLPDDNLDQEPSLDFALEERDRVLMYDREAPNLLSVRCVLTLANIFRGLSFVSGNEITLCKNRALITLASQLLLLSPRHSPANTTAPAVVTQHCSTSWPLPHHPRINYVLRDCWLTVSKDVMVLLSNVAGKLDLQTLPDDVISGLLNSLVNTLLDPNSLKLVHNLATVHNAPTRKFMALEILCKLSVSDSNMDYILATLCLAQLEQLVSCLIEMLTGKESTETVLKECSLVLLLNLGLGDAATGFVFNLISHVPHSICAIVEFMEEIECNASRVIHTQGFPALRDNPELMGTSLSMLRRSANLLLNLALKTDCKALFFRLQNRLLNLVMSQILDQNVANIIADILHILSANQSDDKES